jgi:DNA polymerase
MGDNERTKSKQKREYTDTNGMGFDNCSRSIRKNRNWKYDNSLSSIKKLAAKPFAITTGFPQPTFDILNCGPRRRFTVLGNDGPFIVHNCVQAIARDVLANSMLWLDGCGYKLVAHAHDEVVCEVEDDASFVDLVEKIMSRPVSWAPGLPLAAKGFESKFYRK